MKKPSILSITFPFLASVCLFCSDASLEGEEFSSSLKVKFLWEGPIPEPAKLKVDKDVEYYGKYDLRDESIVVGKDKGIKNIFLYVRSTKIPVSSQIPVEKTVLIDNRHASFQPHALSLWVGKQELRIVNSDPSAHTVAFTPVGDAAGNYVLNSSKETKHQFLRKQTYPTAVYCNYHPWMKAYILPRDNPYVGISDEKGIATIRHLPLGSWEFQVWHEKTGPLEIKDWPKGRFTREIKAGENDLGTIVLSSSLFTTK